MLCVKESQVFSSTVEVLLLAPALSLVSQARPTSTKMEGSGELRIQAVSHYTVQCGTCSILSHDALHDCLSSNSSLENGERELGHLFRYYRSCKNTSTIPLGERAYSTTGKFKSTLFDIWPLHHPANCIPVGHGLYTQFTRPFPSFAEVGRSCETTLYY